MNTIASLTSCIFSYSITFQHSGKFMKHSTLTINISTETLGNKIVPFQQQKIIIRIRKVIQKKKKALHWLSHLKCKDQLCYQEIFFILKNFFCLNPLKTKYLIGNKSFYSLQIKIKMKLQDVFLSGICEQGRVWGTEKL